MQGLFCLYYTTLNVPELLKSNDSVTVPFASCFIVNLLTVPLGIVTVYPPVDTSTILTKLLLSAPESIAVCPASLPIGTVAFNDPVSFRDVVYV